MKNKIKKDLFKRGKENCVCAKPSGGGIYFLGMVGTMVYYLQTATSFWVGVLGILKAIIWPVFLVYNTFKFLAG